MTWMQGGEEPNQAEKDRPIRDAQDGLQSLRGWRLARAFCFITATQIQGLIILNGAHYVFERWHGTPLLGT